MTILELAPSLDDEKQNKLFQYALQNCKQNLLYYVLSKPLCRGK